MNGYEEYQDRPGDNMLASISACADELKRLEAKVVEANIALKAAVEAVRVMSETTLPELMIAAGQRSVTTLSGLEVTLDDTIYANISKERAPEALKWLVDNGHEALIKNEYTVAFPKDSTDVAAEFEDYLSKNMKRKANLKHKTSVHPSTLSAFVREELDGGHELPLELLGVVQKKVVKVK